MSQLLNKVALIVLYTFGIMFALDILGFDTIFIDWRSFIGGVGFFWAADRVFTAQPLPPSAPSAGKKR